MKPRKYAINRLFSLTFSYSNYVNQDSKKVNSMLIRCNEIYLYELKKSKISFLILLYYFNNFITIKY